MTHTKKLTNETTTTPVSTGAHFDDDAAVVVVEHLIIADNDAIREAQRWTTGERGPFVEDTALLGGAEVSAYVFEAIRIGSLALSATGQAQETKALERMLKELGEKTADSTERAVAENGRAMKDASEVVSRAAAEARKAITEADAQGRKELNVAVSNAKNDLNGEVRRIFGGESPELLEKLTPLLDRFGAGLDEKVQSSAEALVAKAARQFDPSDPTSPVAKHNAALDARQAALTAQIEKQHDELTKKVDELVLLLKVEEARASIAKVTPIKGGPYEDEIHMIMHDVAAGLGDEYTETDQVAGRIPRCYKGDGLLQVSGTEVRVLLEMTDSPRNGWGAYFDEAERNRGAAVCLGLVRTVGQNNDQTIRLLGPGRIVMAFDPGHDRPELLRTVVMLLRTVAMAHSSRRGAAEIASAEERISEALEKLNEIDAIKKSAVLITKHARDIDGKAEGLAATIQRLLRQALDALDAVEEDGGVEAPIAEAV